MTHIRQQIRSRVVSDLTGLALTGSNIQDTRLYNLTQIQLPCLEIYTENENSEISTIGPNVTLDRELDLIVIGYAEANTGIEDTLDTIALQVENALGADLTLNNLAVTQYLENTVISFTSEGEKPIGTVTLSYKIRYMNNVLDASQPL
jgi:hypothetical protein|tara:strand:- start:1578 stop:2021 length:444 start_codon:yes stop_codon:yes gene_type:complete